MRSYSGENEIMTRVSKNLSDNLLDCTKVLETLVLIECNTYNESIILRRRNDGGF